MRSALRKLWAIALPVIEPLVGVPVVLVLHLFDATGPSPLWLQLAVLLPLILLLDHRVQLALAGGDLSRRLWLRVGLHLGLALTLALYAYGWGSAFTVAYALGAIVHIRWSGSRAWLPVACWAVAGTAVGQAGIAFGLVFTYLSPTSSHVLAFTGCLLTVMFARQFGLAVAEREQAQADAERRGLRFTALVQHSSDIIVVVNRDGTVAYISPAVEQSLGYRPEEIIGAQAVPYLPPGEQERLAALVVPLMDDPGAQVQVELSLRHRDGSQRWHDALLINRYDDPAVQGLIVNQRDITEQRAAAERLTYDATHDPITGLHNRRAFLSRLEETIGRLATNGSSLAVLYIDLDGFKEINDRYGHEAGDGVLGRVGEVLRASVLGGDVISRLGGDEFAAVLRNVSTPDHGVAVARRFLAALSEPLEVAGQGLRVAASVGIAMAGPPEETGAELLHRADLAMYAAKRRGLGGWVMHSSELELSATTISRQDLLDAIEGEQLRLQYQPLVDLGSGRLLGVEALVRWHHPVRGMVQPNDFIPAAEANGAIHALGAWVAERACQALAGWQRLTPDQPITLGINVSPRQLELPATADRLGAILAATGVRPQDVMVEVTEGALVSVAARQTLDAVAALGVTVAIDDFGTGYSSLQYLNDLPIDTLKLDRSFVAQLHGSPLGSAIPAAVASLAKTLGLATVAEGVETAEQAAELRELGFQQGQGYLFARPLDPTAIEPLILADRLRTSAERNSTTRIA